MKTSSYEPKFVFEDFLSSAACEPDGTSLSSQHLAAVPKPNIAELVPSVFFSQSTTMVFATVRTPVFIAPVTHATGA